MRRLATCLAQAAVAIAAAACAPSPPTENPIPSIALAESSSGRDTVVVMLPGRGDRAETFIREGFESAGEQYGFDTVLVDAHFGYYRNRTLISRLHQDIIQPARESGYQSIWLLGISLGGFGSALYLADHPDQVDGVILLAPYLGGKNVGDEIKAAGGIQAWQPDASNLEPHEIRLWSWLQDVSEGKIATPIIFGYGTSDRMAPNYDTLVTKLAPSRVYTVEGGHNWDAWRALWARIAQEQLL